MAGEWEWKGKKVKKQFTPDEIPREKQGFKVDMAYNLRKEEVVLLVYADEVEGKRELLGWLSLSSAEALDFAEKLRLGATLSGKGDQSEAFNQIGRERGWEGKES